MVVSSLPTPKQVLEGAAAMKISVKLMLSACAALVEKLAVSATALSAMKLTHDIAALCFAAALRRRSTAFLDIYMSVVLACVAPHLHAISYPG
jgi:hypothetical protein